MTVIPSNLPSSQASIGFAIPITKMFSGPILWRGLVYTILMIMGKLFTGLVLVRFDMTPFLFLRSKRQLQEKSKSDSSQSPTTAPSSSQNSETRDQQDTENTYRKRHPSPALKPKSLYPAAILGSAMVARGEIGFLISSLAESTGVFRSASDDENGSSETFLVVTWAILLCTVLGPLSVGALVKRVRRLQMDERARGTGKVDPLGVWGVM